MKHSGTLDDLSTKIKGCGFTPEPARNNGAGYWFPSTGTLQIQGKPDPKKKLEDAWAWYEGHGSMATPADGQEATPSPDAPVNPSSASKKVFIVHGHDDTAREQLELVIHKLGLDKFILANTCGGGLTLIEALEI